MKSAEQVNRIRLIGNLVTKYTSFQNNLLKKIKQMHFGGFYSENRIHQHHYSIFLCHLNAEFETWVFSEEQDMWLGQEKGGASCRPLRKCEAEGERHCQQWTCGANARTLFSQRKAPLLLSGRKQLKETYSKAFYTVKASYGHRSSTAKGRLWFFE